MIGRVVPFFILCILSGFGLGAVGIRIYQGENVIIWITGSLIGLIGGYFIGEGT